MANLLKFEVGLMYENMKGIYEVISIDDDSMLIRWKDGNEIVTTVDLQSRIIERMTREKESEKQEKDEKQQKRKEHKKKGSAGFSGFKSADFKDTSKDTDWRRQDNIGSAVIKQLRTGRTAFSSRAILRQPEVHWMDGKRHNRQGSNYGIGFFARVDQKSLYYGIHIQRSAADRRDELEGWNPFKIWLARKENENWLKQIVVAHDLIIHDASMKSFTHDITVHDKDWELKSDKIQNKIESLSSFLAALSDSRQIDLRIQKVTSKEETLAKGENIVEEISTLFNRLMPLYELASVPVDAK